jgi:flavin reductase ActVB
LAPASFPAEPAHRPLAGRPSIEGDRFRRALARLAAGVCIVTTVDGCGDKLGLTATAVTSVSLDPPLVLVCIDQRSRTIAPLRAGTPFVLHILAAGQEALARRFASFALDKFTGVAHRVLPSRCPLLDGVLAGLECAVHRLVPAGDHTIIIGRVVGVHVGEADESPLVYCSGRFVEIER